MSGSGRKHFSKRDSRDESILARRSRSRSPASGYRWDSEFDEQKIMRAGGSTKPCRDFAAGNCRRGSNCHFLHDDNFIYEDGWESRPKQDGPPGYSAPRESGGYFLRSGRSNVACINFPKGRCRMGASCKFVHHDTSSVGESTREMEIDRRRMENTLEWGGGQGPNHSRDIPCKFFAFGNCRNGNHCRFSHDRQACESPNRRLMENTSRIIQGGDQALDMPKLNDSVNPDGRLKDDRRGSGSNMADVVRVLDCPKQTELVSVFDTAKRVEDSRNEIMGAPIPEFTGWPYRVGWDHSSDKNRLLGESPFSGDDKKETNSLEAENAGGLSTEIWPGNEKMSPDWNHGVRSSSHIEEKHGQNRQQVPPGRELNQNAQNPIALHSSSGHVVGQSQVPVSVIPPRVGSVEGTQNQEISIEKKYTVEPNIMVANLLQVGSTNPQAQNMVSKEQLAQLTSISASLVQILGSVQQLPQLHAALNSHGAKDTSFLGKTEGSSKPLFPTLIKSDHAVGLQKRHDPIRDSVEPRNANASMIAQYFSPIKKSTEDAAEIPPLLSNSGRPNLDNSSKTALAEEKPVKSDDHFIQLQQGKAMEVIKKKDVRVAEEKKSSQCANESTKEDSPMENEDQKGEPDGSKKTKDAKGIRAFKYSLVEFVKELLKPTWKEGKINKDDYKSIVKKVADKVTSTVQRAHIPQTQEKIDHYLSLSKPKLNKLLQAYVEKVQKS